MGISFQKSASQQIPLHVERPLSLDHDGGVPSFKDNPACSGTMEWRKAMRVF